MLEKIGLRNGRKTGLGAKFILAAALLLAGVSGCKKDDKPKIQESGMTDSGDDKRKNRQDESNELRLEYCDRKQMEKKSSDFNFFDTQACANSFYSDKREKRIRNNVQQALQGNFVDFDNVSSEGSLDNIFDGNLYGVFKAFAPEKADILKRTQVLGGAPSGYNGLYGGKYSKDKGKLIKDTKGKIHGIIFGDSSGFDVLTTLSHEILGHAWMADVKDEKNIRNYTQEKTTLLSYCEGYPDRVEEEIYAYMEQYRFRIWLMSSANKDVGLREFATEIFQNDPLQIFESSYVDAMIQSQKTGDWSQFRNLIMKNEFTRSGLFYFVQHFRKQASSKEKKCFEQLVGDKGVLASTVRKESPTGLTMENSK